MKEKEIEGQKDKVALRFCVSEARKGVVSVEGKCKFLDAMYVDDE